MRAARRPRPSLTPSVDAIRRAPALLGARSRLLLPLAGATAQHHDLAAGLLDRGESRGRGADDLDRDRRGDVSLAEQAHAVERPTDQAGGDEAGGIDGLPGVD